MTGCRDRPRASDQLTSTIFPRAWRLGLGAQAISAALRPRGYLVFETRRPERRAWEEWAADTSPVILDVPGSGQVEQSHEITGVSLPFVSFRNTYTFLADGAVITSDSILRFRSREEVEIKSHHPGLPCPGRAGSP